MLIGGGPANRHLTVPPVLVVEILSPATEEKDRNAKFLLYQSHDVRHYVIANPISQHLEVFQLESSIYRSIRPLHPQKPNHAAGGRLRIYRPLPAADPLMLALDDLDAIELSLDE
ncbi:MAG: Uma2 family endonuclease [Planctomycetaceae bacterium]|nr:Uma2 family endonuclease [Planctomycetaceae bacterium]